MLYQHVNPDGACGHRHGTIAAAVQCGKRRDRNQAWTIAETPPGSCRWRILSHREIRAALRNDSPYVEHMGDRL